MTDGQEDQDCPDLEQLLATAWPHGVPGEEDALARSLPPARRQLAAARLAAVLSVEQGKPVKDAAHLLKMDRIAFFRLRQRWSAARSLRSITPFMGRAPRRVGTAHKVEARIADELVASAPRPLRFADLVDTLLERAGGMSRQTAMRLLRQAGARASASVEEIARELGEEIAVDLVGTAMTVEGEVVAVGLAIETSSRFILGFAAGTITQAGSVVAEAASDAASAAPRWKAPTSLAEGRLRLVVPGDEHGFDAKAFGASAAKMTGDVKLLVSGERRFGAAAANLLGHRIGRLTLHPRALLTGEAPRNAMVTAREVSLADARSLVAEAVRHHNVERLGVLLEAIARKDNAVSLDLARATTLLEPMDAFLMIIGDYGPWRDGAARLALDLRRLEVVADMLLRHAGHG